MTVDQVKALPMATANRTYFPQTSTVSDPTSGLVYNANYDILTRGAGYLDLEGSSESSR